MYTTQQPGWLDPQPGGGHGIASMRTADISVPTVPGTYWLWLAGLGWTSVGLNLLHFGMVWEAAAHSPALAGAVLLVVILPRATISLLGGSVADRLGPLRVMMIADAVMTVAMLGIVAALLTWGSSPGLLLTSAATLGVADAFYQPSSGAVPKFLVPTAGLPRAMAARQVVSYGAGIIGPVLGGVTVSAVGLPLAFGLGAVGFAGMLAVLIMLRTRVSFSPASDCAAQGHSGASMLSELRQGLHLVWSAPLLRGMAALTAGFAAFVLPVTSLLIPVLAVDRGWGPTTAGTASGAFGAGMAVVALLVMLRSGASGAGVTAILGMLLAGVGVAGLGLAPEEGAAVTAAAAAGVGSGLFATHLAPVFMAAVPRETVGRAQAVLLMAQTLPLLLVQPMLGVAAEQIPPAAITTVCGTGALLVALAAACSSSLRSARRPD